MVGLFGPLFAIIAAFFGFLTTGPVDPDPHFPKPPIPTSAVEFPTSVSHARLMEVADGCSNFDNRSRGVILAAMLPECDGAPNPGLRDGQGIPPVHLDQLEPAGQTAQGFPVGYAEEPVYVCTNACSRWRDHVAVISVPAGATGANSAAVHVSFAVSTEQVDSKEAFIKAIKAVRVEP